ncbi:MAG TPA: hypothetical protein DIT65_01365 [Cryomorphaceae bacterium]|nr:hypothetical protein [Cryomorphaceae bacterium]|tara:strand:+ start:850 stop:2856 length:2007 start_codon:yes stop_codon:yes gene_type:complete
MKKLLLLSLFFLSSSATAQSFGPAQGFPLDPVISAAFEGDRLYLGTQGSGVYELFDGSIKPSMRFEKFNRSSIYSFFQNDTVLVPVVQGDLQAYPIEVINGYGTKYIVTADGVQVRFSDVATQASDKPSGIWRMTLGFERLNFLRMGSELVTLDQTGYELERQNFKGLIFDLAPTDYGLLLSAESGYYQWNNKNHKWNKVGSGLPIFAFDGPMARTPLGSIQVNKLLDGNWSTDDFVRLAYVRESYEEAYDIDSVADLTYTFSSSGVAVMRDSFLLYTIDGHRDLPDLRPGNYDVARIGTTLYVATPLGMYTFNNGGDPNVPYATTFNMFIDGIASTNVSGALTAPNSVGFSASVNVESNSPVLGRYKVNEGTWESWDLGGPILLEYPAPGNYNVQIQVDTRADFSASTPAQFTFTIKALWYKRPASWAIIITILAAIVVFWQRQERLRANERLDLQERLAEAELQSKRGQMNPHFLFNALDAISNFIFKNQPKDAVLYMGKLAKLMRLTLESLRSNEMILADEIDLLNKYIDLCILRYGDFTWQLDVADDLDLYDTKLPPMLVQPLVENAVQHAMRPNFASGKPGVILAQIVAKENALYVVIEDNGPGIADIETASKSHGLVIISERLALLTKKNGAPYRFELESVEKDGSILGTRVSLILPLANEY